eukprot:6192736-Pleurochrysis_carterae.AAC.1
MTPGVLNRFAVRACLNRGRTDSRENVLRSVRKCSQICAKKFSDLCENVLRCEKRENGLRAVEDRGCAERAATGVEAEVGA